MPKFGSKDIGNGAGKMAVVDASGRPESIRSERGDRSWPSCVYSGLDGSVEIGEGAREYSYVHPDRVAVGWKMHLGDGVKRYFGGTATAEDVVAMVVRHVMSVAERQIGQKIDGLVITCPANFTDPQRTGLVAGFEKAGVRVVQVITEPAAAAFAYCSKMKEGLVICIDVGHGTTDVSVLAVKDGVAVPVSTEGVPQLGGRNFTAAIEAILLEKISKSTGKRLSLEKLAPDQRAELEAKAEKAKLAFGTLASTKVPLNFGGKSQLIEVTQEEYERKTADLVKQILSCADKAMDAIQKSWGDFDNLVLAGGPCQSPRLQGWIADHTGLVPKIEIDPVFVVSFGAAMHAHQLALAEGGGRVLPHQPVLQEATAHDIGVAVIDESSNARPLVCSVVVPKNTPVPHEHPPQLFRLPSEANTEAYIEIVQGPDGAPLNQCARIGTIHLKGLPRETQRSYRIEIMVRFDNNTMCEVTARDHLSGITQTVSVKLQAKAAA